jgi:hypothetical protein
VAPDNNPAQEVEIERIMFRGQQKSSSDPISTNKKLGVGVCTCHPSYMEELSSRPAWAKSKTLYEE